MSAQVIRALLFADVVDSTALVERLGDAQAAALWTEHDRLSRELLATQGGLEIDRSDGFFLLFDDVAGAARFALGYHAAVARLGLSARVGLHHAAVTLRKNPAEAVARGAKPLEVEGLAKPLAARVMSLARGGQTLLSQAAGQALASIADSEIHAHGHYRVKGLSEPLEVLELGAVGSAFIPPADSEKVYRVVRIEGLWQALREVRHNLAPERDAFVGRASELHQLAQRLEGGVRLLTVLGVGGTGKTRLVLRFARAWLGDWPGGVAFCDLSDARSLDGIHFAVALALGVPLGKGDPAVQIGHAIAARGRVLVIADNFEQVVAHAAATVGAWLDRAPEAVFVVTSRERLHLPGEQSLALEPLPVHSDAIELFAVRARAQRADFALEPHRAHVAEVVRLLDGLPLAVELAAARVRVLSPAQILERLAQRFQLLAGVRGASARQATLRAAIDWSWELLSAVEQAAFVQCAVFEGGFTMEAAEAVLDLAAFPAAPQVMDVVQSLVDKSLLRAWVPGTTARLAIAEPLFGMYLSIHEYAVDKLDHGAGGGRADAEVRHGRHFAGHGSDQALERLVHHGGTQRRHSLLLELDNLAAACRRAIARGDVAVAEPAYRAAWEVLVLRGPFEIGATLGSAVLALADPASAAWRDAASCLADALFRLGRLELEHELLAMTIDSARRGADRKREGIARRQLANLLREQGRMTEARPEFEAALALNIESGNDAACAATQHGLGNLLDQIGEPTASRAHHEAALALHEQMGNPHGQAHVHASLGILNRHQGRLEDSLRSYQTALELLREVGDRRSEGVTIGNMANTLGDLGRDDDSLRCLEEALAINRSVGSRVFEAHTLANLALAYKQRRRWDEARAHLMLALAIAGETHNPWHEGVVLTNLGNLEADRGHFDTALDYFAQAKRLHLASSNRLYVGITAAAIGQALLARGSAQAALAELEAGEAVLRAIDNPLELLVLLCVQGRAWHALGDAGRARLVLRECESIAAAMGPGSRAAGEVGSLKRLLDGESP